MFERYTARARRVIFFSRYEACQFGSPFIESEHLLLGLLREDKNISYRFLQDHTSVESIRKQIEGHTTIRKKVSTSVDLPLSNECGRIFAYAAEEADLLSHKFIGTEHLLLGICREQDCFAAKLLNERGVFLDKAREQIGGGPPEQLGCPPRSHGLPAGYTAHKLLYNIASETLILELRRPGVLPSRLFTRHKNAEAYEQIGCPAEDVFYESPVTCDGHPVVVFNSLKWDKARTGGDWDGVYTFNLNTKEISSWISREGLRYLEPHGRIWIIELVSLSDDAQTVYVKMAVEKVVFGRGIVHYYLAKVDLLNHEAKLLSRLADILF